MIEAQLLIEPLTSFEPHEKKACKWRPHLLLKQQRAVAKIFEVRSENILEEFDQELPQIFVNHYIGKLSEPVPLQA
jgi:hypothetical protein